MGGKGSECRKGLRMDVLMTKLTKISMVPIPFGIILAALAVQASVADSPISRACMKAEETAAYVILECPGVHLTSDYVSITNSQILAPRAPPDVEIRKKKL